MTHTGRFRRRRGGGRPRPLLLRREVRPVERHAVGAMRAFEGMREAVFVIDIGRHNLGSEAGELLRLLGMGIARDGTRLVVAPGVAQNGAHQSTALRAGSADYGNDFLLGPE